MGKKVLAVIIVTAFLVAGLLNELEVSSAKAGVTTTPFCELFYANQLLNQVTTTLTWRDASEAGTQFQFGDGSSTFVGGPAGTLVPLWHAYSYQVGGVTWYTQSVVFTGTDGVSTTSCEMPIVIEDQSVITKKYKLFLPAVFKPAPVLTSSLVLGSYVGPEWNHAHVNPMWGGANEAWQRLTWGDGSYVDLFGSSGNVWLDHMYPYPGGRFTVTFDVTGPVGAIHQETAFQVYP